MKQFYSFVRKEFKHIFRDKQTVLILLVMPLVLIGLFGFALSMEVRGTRVAVLDQQQSQQSRRVVQRVDANAYFSVTHHLHGPSEIDPLLRQGQIDMAIIIRPRTAVGHGETEFQLLADGSEPNMAQTRVLYLQQIIGSSVAAEKGRRLTASFVQSPQRHTPTVVTRLLFNPQSISAYNFVPGVIGVILLLICAMMTSISIVREKERGTMEILLASPLPPFYIVVAKLLPFLVVSSVNVCTILLLSHYVLGVPIAGSILVYGALTLLYIIVALALGLFISTVVNSQLAAMLLSLLLIVPTIYLSGMVFPVESMPAAAARVSQIIPTRWYIDAARKLLIQGVSPSHLTTHFAVLALEAAVLLMVSVKLFKTRLE